MPDHGIFDEDHEEFRQSFRRFLARDVTPHYPRWRSDNSLPRAVFKTAGENGFLGILAPEEFGGAGLNDFRFGLVMVQEAMAAGATGLALMLARHSCIAIPAITQLGTDELKKDWLPGLVEGTLLASVAKTTSATSASEVIGARTVDLILASSPSGILVLDTRIDGIKIEAVTAPLAVEEAPLGDVTFSGVDGLMGDGSASLDLESDGYLWLAAIDTSGASAALDLTVTYTRERSVFGSPLASLENTQIVLSRTAAHLWAAETLVHGLVQSRTAGAVSVHRSAGARIVASDLLNRAVDEGLQLHGGYGYMREYPIAQAYADAGLLSLLSRLLPEVEVFRGLGLNR